MSSRRKYTKEFKLDAVSLVTEQKYTCAEAAMSLSINPNILSRWIRELSEKDESAFRGNGKLTAEQTEIRQLREEVRLPRYNYMRHSGYGRIIMNDQPDTAIGGIPPRQKLALAT